jgi:hypothetical protein
VFGRVGEIHFLFSLGRPRIVRTQRALNDAGAAAAGISRPECAADREGGIRIADRAAFRIFSSLSAGMGPPTRRRSGMKPFRLLLAFRWGRLRVAFRIRF